MKRFSTTVEIEAPPDRIWRTLRDVERWSQWTPSIISIRRLDPGPFAAGSRAIVRQPKLLPARWLVTEVEEGRGFTWVTGGPGLLVTASHSIERAGSRCQVTLSLDFSGIFGPIVARLIRGLNARYLALEAQGLKKHTESLVLSGPPGPDRFGETR